MIKEEKYLWNSNLHLINLISGESYFLPGTNRANGTNTDIYTSSGVMIKLMHPSRVVDTSFHLLATYREWDFGFSKILNKTKQNKTLYGFIFKYEVCIVRRFVVKFKSFLNWFWYKKKYSQFKLWLLINDHPDDICYFRGKKMPLKEWRCVHIIRN